MSPAKDVKKLLRLVEGEGCTVSRTKKSHWRVQLPGGGIVILPSSPSDHRALANVTSMLRRNGVDIRL